MDGKLRNMATVYLFHNEKILLLYRKGGRVVNNVWTGSAGGHFEESDLNDARSCVLREMKEELGLCPDKIDGLTLRYITMRNTNGEIRQNYYFFATLKEILSDDLISNEGDCKWFSINEIGALEMPFTAKYVLEHFLTYGHLSTDIYVGVADTDRVNSYSLPES